MAIDCQDYNCDLGALGTFHENACAKDFLGNHTKAIVFGCSATTTDFTNSAQIYADLDNNRAWRISRAVFSINEPTANKTESIVPCEPASVDSYSYSLDYANPNVNTDNDEVHNLMFSGAPFGAMLINECQSTKDGYLRVKLIEAQIRFEGGLSSVTGQKQQYKGKAFWEDYMPLTIAEAPGIWTH